MSIQLHPKPCNKPRQKRLHVPLYFPKVRNLSKIGCVRLPSYSCPTPWSPPTDTPTKRVRLKGGSRNTLPVPWTVPRLLKTLYKNTALALAIQEWKRHNPEVVRKDQEEDRRLELAALRAKPKPVVQPPPQLVVSYQPRPYISQVATLTIPGWQVVRNMLSRDHTPQSSPRSTMSASRAVVPM